MFILSEMQDIVRIEPRRFGQDMTQEIRDELNRKLANKVSLTACTHGQLTRAQARRLRSPDIHLHLATIAAKLISKSALLWL